MAQVNQSPTKVITGMVRFSYVHVFEPTAIDENSEAKYSVSILIDKDDKQTLSAIQVAIEEAKKLGKTKLVDSKGNIARNLKTPLRDGDVERPEDEAYAGCMFLTASSFKKPGVVGKPATIELGEDEFYSGCYGRASLTFYAFNKAGSKGIACGLNNVQKLEDGERLDGGVSAAADFGDDDDNDLM